MIHHYTTIDNLALILESKRIRFTRLDLLDDIQEIKGLDHQILKLDKSIFVSSWTEDNEENIPLWKMYASITNGIRITMPQDMFQKHLISAFAENNHGMTIDMYSPFTKALNPQLHSRSATYIKRNGLLIRKITIKSSRPFQCAYHPLTP